MFAYRGRRNVGFSEILRTCEMNDPIRKIKNCDSCIVTLNWCGLWEQEYFQDFQSKKHQIVIGEAGEYENLAAGIFRSVILNKQ